MFSIGTSVAIISYATCMSPLTLRPSRQITTVVAISRALLKQRGSSLLNYRSRSNSVNVRKSSRISIRLKWSKTVRIMFPRFCPSRWTLLLLNIWIPLPTPRRNRPPRTVPLSTLYTRSFGIAKTRWPAPRRIGISLFGVALWIGSPVFTTTYLRFPPYLKW